MTTFLILVMLWLPIACLAAMTIGWALGVLDPETPRRPRPHVAPRVTVIYRPYDQDRDEPGDAA